METIHTAGWFEDPTGRNLRRFWDGTQWTGHVQHQDGSSATDPITLTGPVVQGTPGVPTFSQPVVQPAVHALGADVSVVVTRGPISRTGQVLFGGTVVAAVASFLPWVKFTGPFGYQSAVTPSRGGLLVYILTALAATTWAAWPAATRSLSKKRCVWLTVAVAVVSLYAIGVFYGLHQVQTAIDGVGQSTGFLGVTDIAKCGPGLGLFIYSGATLTLWAGVFRAWRTLQVHRTMPVSAPPPPGPIGPPPFAPPGSYPAALVGPGLAVAPTPPSSKSFAVPGLVWLGIAAMAVGPFLDWMGIRERSRRITGVKSQAPGTWLVGSIPDGYFMIGLAALALLAAFSFNSNGQRGKAQLLALVGLAGAVFAGVSWVGFKHHVDQQRLLGNFFRILPPGVGFWLAAGGAIFVLIGGLAAQSKAQR